MQKNLKNYISEHIKNLGVKKNDRLLVYSDLSKFGIDNIRSGVYCTDLPTDGSIDCEYCFTYLAD